MEADRNYRRIIGRRVSRWAWSRGLGLGPGLGLRSGPARRAVSGPRSARAGPTTCGRAGGWTKAAAADEPQCAARVIPARIRVFSALRSVLGRLQFRSRSRSRSRFAAHAMRLKENVLTGSSRPQAFRALEHASRAERRRIR